MAKTRTTASNKKLPVVEKRSGTESWKWLVGILLSIAAIYFPYHEWKKDRAPAIRYVDYQLLGTLGQTALNFQSHYRNVGKRDATEVTMESRLFTAGQYDPSLQKAESLPHGKGTVGPGIDLFNQSHSVSLTDSAAMMSPLIDQFRVWLHERVSYKDEDGNPQAIVDVCLVWDRKHQIFVQCP